MRTKKHLFLLFFLNFAFPQSIFAIELKIKVGRGYVNDISRVLNSSLQLVFMIASLISFFFLVAAGIKWIASGGDRAKIEEARNQIVASVVGLLIMSSSWAIMNFTLGLLGFNGGLAGLFENVPTLVASEQSSQEKNNTSTQTAQREHLNHKVLDTSLNQKDLFFFLRKKFHSS